MRRFLLLAVEAGLTFDLCSPLLLLLHSCAPLKRLEKEVTNQNMLGRVRPSSLKQDLTLGAGWNRTGAAGAAVLNKPGSKDPEAAGSVWNRLPDT